MSAHEPARGGTLARVLGLVGASLAGGLLITVGVTPALAVTGLAENNPIGLFETVPEYLELGQLAQKTEIYAKNSDGTDALLASFYAQNREEVAFDQVSQFVKDAAVATEDPRFYEHGGVDLQGTIRAVLSNLVGDDLQGGSSITQQYVKNVLVQKAESLSDTDAAASQAAYDEATATTPGRKLKEMKLAVDLEKKYSKDDILLGYLNIAGFGGQVYGIQAAAEYYFSTTAASLTLAQAASLIATVNNPNGLRIDDPDNIPDNKVRRDYVLDQMLKEGKISQADHDAATAEEVVPAITQTPTGCQTAGNAAFFCDYVTRVIQNDPAFGSDESTRFANFQRGGYKIYTTLDRDLQDTANAATVAAVPRVTTKDVNIGSSTVSMEVGTGRILAMVQNKDYDAAGSVNGENYTAINFNTDTAYGGSAGFQVGSTYKVFTLAQWLANGRTLFESVNGRVRTFEGFPASCVPGGEDDTPYKVVNDDDENGTYSVLTGTMQSINTVYLAMAQKLDLCAIRDQAAAFGVKAADGGELGVKPPSILGADSNISPLSMVTAFAGFANNGTACSAIAIDSITDATGAAVQPPTSTCTQALSPELTSVANYALQRVVTGGTATASNPDDGIEHIGKTGTTDNAESTWMDGASSKVATVVWVGNIVGHMSMREVRFPNSDLGSQQYASNIRHYIWNEVMTRADEKFKGDDFAEPSSALLNGRLVTIPDVSGQSVDAATTTLDDLGFSVDEGATVDSAAPAGTVAGTDPAAGTTAPRYSDVTLQISNGSQVAPPAPASPTTTPTGAATPPAGATGTPAPAGPAPATASPTPTATGAVAQ
ncbi:MULTISPECIES: transglycosylase domain-containing protein [unclassified Rathayibacter]|uniref:transglycosylase domain-containing protein n=1 Tax=unclassified Rathayibacter TaxID=2609250 RepID=UPI001889E4F0|nr:MULTISPECIES: transglycosylase domain-containing protein [unclassified Rathayibacter]MBF4462023.1 penicillin-binding protein [Rathayibacter sp. VKM Ac-2879]MBF4503934.1 penicillin-binding protein [Rathayibacter sp. VKM Ac-2878]